MNKSMQYRRIKKRILTINYDELNRLKDDETAFIKIVKCRHHLAIHPYHLLNVKKALDMKLNEEICRYNKKVNGIVLGFKNVKILDNIAPINNDMCFIHVDIEVEFFVFMPAVGQVHKGIVNKLSNNQVCCLVHKIFNVFLPKPNEEDDWLGCNARIGQEIEFRITKVDLGGSLPYIRGDFVSILSEDSGISTAEADEEDLYHHEEDKKLKKKNYETKNNINNPTIQLEDSPSKKHKAKKHKHFTTEENVEDALENNEGHKKDKNKIKKQSNHIPITEEKYKLEFSLEENEIPKRKKHKTNKHIIEIPESEENQMMDYLLEEIEKPKKKKHKSKKHNTQHPITEEPQKLNNSPEGNENSEKKKLKTKNEKRKREYLVEDNEEPKKKKHKNKMHSIEYPIPDEKQLEKKDQSIINKDTEELCTIKKNIRLIHKNDTAGEHISKKHKKLKEELIKDLNLCEASNSFKSVNDTVDISKITFAPDSEMEELFKDIGKPKKKDFKRRASEASVRKPAYNSEDDFETPCNVKRFSK